MEDPVASMPVLASPGPMHQRRLRNLGENRAPGHGRLSVPILLSLRDLDKHNRREASRSFGEGHSGCSEASGAIRLVLENVPHEEVREMIEGMSRRLLI